MANQANKKDPVESKVHNKRRMKNTMMMIKKRISPLKEINLLSHPFMSMKNPQKERNRTHF